MLNEWVEQASCASVGADPFFVGKGGSVKGAKRVCAGCPVIEPCLEEAMRTDAVGIWGGMTRRERRRVRNAEA